MTRVNPEVVLGFQNQLTEGLKEYHQSCLSISHLHVPLHGDMENGGCCILKMGFLPGAAPGRSRLITIFTNCNLLPNRTQHNLRAKPQWPGLTHMPIPGPVTAPWTMVHTEWSRWVLRPPQSLHGLRVETDGLRGKLRSHYLEKKERCGAG